MGETLEPQQEFEINRQEVGDKLEINMPIIPERGIVVIGDIHLFAYRIGPFTIRIDGRRAIRYLKNIPERFQPDVFILNGDAFDLSSQPDIEFSLIHCRRFFDDLREKRMKVIYLSGNHDNIKVLEVLKSEFGDFITFGDYLTIGEGEVKEVRVEHGHLVTMAPIGLDLKAQLIKEQEEDQKRRSVFKRTVLKVFSRIPLEGPLAIVGNNVVGGWINRWRFIPPKLKAKVITTDTKMREYAEQGTSANLHIFGHTHTVAQGEKYINPGSFLRVPIMRDRFVAVYLDEEGKAQLIDCVTGKETTVKEIYASRITSLMRVVGRIIERAKLIE